MAIFLALVCPTKNYSAHKHQNETTFAAVSTFASGGENGHIHP